MIERAPPKPIDLVVIGGYLGSGKTTLLNHVLAAQTDLKITVLVNDFGGVNIDAALIRSRTDDVINLENGCICCSIGGSLAQTLIALSARIDRPELLLIEASGVSDPARIAQIGMLDKAFRLRAVVVLVDAQSIARTLADPYVGDIVARQIASASAVVLNKTDLATGEQLEAVKSDIALRTGGRPIIEAVNGQVPSALIVDPAPMQRQATWQSSSLKRPPANPEIRSFLFQSDRRFEKKALKHVCETLPATVLRAKGFVRLENTGSVASDDGDEAYELNVVASHVSIRRFSGQAPAGTTMVVIGCFDTGEWEQIAECLRAAQR